MKAYERKVIPAECVATELARINAYVEAKDPYVGKNCIVAWQNPRSGRFAGGCGHLEFEGAQPAHQGVVLPHILRGSDARASIESTISLFSRLFSTGLRGKEIAEALDDQLNEVLNSLPDEPDEKLK
jgi:hypothetical protein